MENIKTQFKPNFEPLAELLMVRYQDQLRTTDFEIVPEEIWNELRDQVKYCSSVVSRQIGFNEAYKIAKNTLAAHLMLANNLCGKSQQLHLWRVRFTESKRFVVFDDLNEDFFKTLKRDGVVNLATQHEAQRTCDSINTEYKKAGLPCPTLEMIPYYNSANPDSNSGNTIMDWLILPYKQS